MFLLLGKREQQQQLAETGRPSFQRDFDDLEDLPRSSSLAMQSQLRQNQGQRPRSSYQQQPRQAARAAPGMAKALQTKTPYYPDNHPMHPDDTRLNVKWPKSRAKKVESDQHRANALEPDQMMELAQPHLMELTQSRRGDPDGLPRLMAPMQPMPPPPPPPLSELNKFDYGRSSHRRELGAHADPNSALMVAANSVDRPPHQPPPPPPPPPPPQPLTRPSDLADQHLHRLFEDIYAIRGEAETVQYKYRKERDAWAYENAVLQAELSQLAEQLRDRSDHVAGLEAAYADEVESLRSENRELRVRIQEEGLMRRAEAEAAAAGAAGGTGAAAERQVDELMAELYALKRELEKLQNRYRGERERWSARRRELEQAVADLLSGRDPKAVQKRLAQSSAAAAAADEAAAAVDDDLAQASMAYYSTANAAKKEKAILELELDDEKRKNRVLEIEVEVLRDQVMRAQNRARGLPEDADGAGGTAGGRSRELDSIPEKGLSEAPEKPLEAGWTGSAAPGTRGRSSRAASVSGLTQPQEQSLQAADKILKMEDRLHEKNVELTSQQQQLSQLKRDGEQATAKLEDAQQRREAAQQKLTEVREELKAAAAERDRAVEENARMKEEGERRKEENRRMREELARVGDQEEKERDAKRKDAEEKARLQDENKEMKDRMERQKRDSEAELDRLRQEKRRLEEKLRHIRDKMQDGQKNYKHFQGEFDELAKLCE